LPTRTQQGDILSTALLSHGDGRHPLYFPASPEECFSMMPEAFNLAERFQTPVFVLTDLDLGMNNWMAEPFTYPETPIDRGKVLSAGDLERLGGFARYQDVDGDAVGWRTLPATTHPSAGYFTRGSGHNEKAQYSERAGDYQFNVDRLARKFEGIRAALPAPLLDVREGARIGLIACGTSDCAMEEARCQLREEHGIESSYLRLRAWPPPPAVEEFVLAHERTYVVEQNRDAQLHGLLRLEFSPAAIARLGSVRIYGGLPIDARSVSDDIARQEAQ
jgi:2-oxoglutarate ferredoxin oxidoreductase subunit alpha